MKKIMTTCLNPFTRLEITLNGSCYFCCTSYVKNEEPIGNIFNQSVEEIWYGEKATEFRKSVLDDSYSKCNLNVCPLEFEKNSFENEDYLNPPYPKFVGLNYVKACNVRCVICRDDLFYESKENTEYYNQFKDKIVKLCSKAQKVFINGCGELFVSKHLRDVCREIVEINPDVKFNILTNGLLFDENHIKDFCFYSKNGHIVSVSIHAAKKKTYEKIMRGGNWEVLQKNLSYISSLKKDNIVSSIYFNFVTHSLNYKEMPKFVKMARKFGAEPAFWRFRKWENASEMNKSGEYEKYTVWEKDNKDYKKFLKVMKKLQKMKTKIYFRDPLFQKLYNQKHDTWLDKVKKVFKFN